MDDKATSAYLIVIIVISWGLFDTRQHSSLSALTTSVKPINRKSVMLLTIATLMP